MTTFLAPVGTRSGGAGVGSGPDGSPRYPVTLQAAYARDPDPQSAAKPTSG